MLLVLYITIFYYMQVCNAYARAVKMFSGPWFAHVHGV